MKGEPHEDLELEALLGEGDSRALERLFELLGKLYNKRRGEVAGRWQRTLPFADYVVDRWEKARELGFGEGTSIYDSAIVLGDVKVGEKTWIGPGVMLDGSGGLVVGSFCSISAGVQIYSHDSVKWAISGGECGYEYAKTVVGNNCYIGPNAIVAKGVTIGDGCIIGANSLVLADVPAGSKAFGTPCRVAGNSSSYLLK
ncbi:acyltransferase [Geomonas sp. Red69]|nr:acyltransferase [Geomonas diazotrophica]MBU5636081.1 acyltransferase [Geomonas diazotrophica]